MNEQFYKGLFILTVTGAGAYIIGERRGIRKGKKAIIDMFKVAAAVYVAEDKNKEKVSEED